MDKNLLAPVLGFVVVLAILFLGSNLFLDKITDKIIERMKRNYVPGPYSPGFDPDKVDPRVFSQQTEPQKFQSASVSNSILKEIDAFENETPQKAPMLDNPEQWNKMWEDSRL